MTADRLSLALADGAVALPDDGRIVVFNAHGADVLAALPRDRLLVVQGFFPEHASLAGAGFDVACEAAGEFAAAMIFLPRAKALARAMVADAARLTGGGLVIVDGQKTDGVDSLLKDIRKRADMGAVISKAHGKLFAFTGGDFTDWAAKDTHLDGFVTRPGVFSADSIDKGSAALVAALPPLRGRVADLGAGWGFLARHILQSDAIEALDLIEADHTALDCARRNVTDPRARFVWADATAHRPEAPYDAVVTNPPFHTGRAGDPELGRAFIRAAAAMLKPGGTLWLVANRHLPYEAEIQRLFRETEEVGGTPGFKILRGAKPRRAKV